MQALGVLCLCLTMLLPALARADAENPARRLYVPDGQVKSHPLRVFIADEEITAQMKPRLVLYASHDLTVPLPGEDRGWQAKLVAPGQQWTEVADGQAVSRTGTLLMFDVSAYPMPAWKPMMRLTPVLTWTDGHDEGQPVVGNQDIYLGHLKVALAWTLALILVLATAIGLAARAKTGHARFLLCGPDHYYSLWRVQLAAWTLAVGGMVFCFGMIRLAVPSIPDSLVALMGLSLATGAVSAAKARKEPLEKEKKDGADAAATPAATADGKEPPPRASKKNGAGMNPKLPAFADLISSFDERLGDVVVSIPKAQMLFWTVVILVLFIAKTLLDGQLWNVPWELVALTGFSQAGYVGDKFTKAQ